MNPLKILALAGLLALALVPANAATRENYPAPEQAQADLAAALKAAPHSHKRILLDFGGNWCPDCQVLDIYFHDAKNLPLLEANFILVHVNIGHLDANTDIAERYEIPLKRGVPAIAVLGERGNLLYSQKTGEFEDMRHMDLKSVTEFLERWKP
jgi:thiol:disulfide interchange protein